MTRHLFRWAVVFVLFSFRSPEAVAQDLSKVPDTPAQTYYDWWLGHWRREVDGKVDTSATEFLVTRSPSGAIVEHWRMAFDSTSLRATGLRSFDKAWNRWMYVWTSSAGHFQVWEERRVGEKWYIYREFDIGGDRYLSRQAWLPDGADRLTRISEKSYDGGVTWQPRFREVYVRVAR
jgi:hypothetical protein